MKIIYKKGNLLDVTKGHIIHGCNAQGVQGAGVALAIRNKYPNCYNDYRSIYEDEGLELGQAYPYCPNTDLIIWNAITQEYFGNDDHRYASYDAIQTCFESINKVVIETDLNIVKEIHSPLIGAGLAHGNWEIISKIIEETCTVPVTVWLLDVKLPNGSTIT